MRRPERVPGLAAGAFVLELSALAVLCSPLSRNETLAAFLSLHAAGSACLALLIWLKLPRRYRQPTGWSQLFLFSLSFFLPFTGLIGLLGAMLVADRLPGPASPHAFQTQSIPDFTPLSGAQNLRFDQGGIRARLRDRSAGTDSRMRALMAIQAMPGRLSSPLLREMLADPADDIRLIAYGMLDSSEKAIRRQITRELRALQAGQSAAGRLQSSRHLAELYWEMIYQDLVQGDVRKHALEQAMDYIHQVLELDHDDAGSWVFHGKLNIEMGYPDAAGVSFRRGLALGYPAPRLLPYLAELAFHQRNFADVKRLLAQVTGFDNAGKTQALLQYWGVQQGSPT